MKPTKSLVRILATVAAIFAGANLAQAQTYTWNNTVGDYNWSTAGNWSSGTPPFSGYSTYISITGNSSALHPITHGSGDDAPLSLQFNTGYLDITGGTVEAEYYDSTVSYVGNGGTAQVSVESAGTFGNQNDLLYLGNGAGGTGNVIMNGGALLGSITNGFSGGTGSITGYGTIKSGPGGDSNPVGFTNNGKVTASGGTLQMISNGGTYSYGGSGSSSGNGYFATSSGILEFASSSGIVGNITGGSSVSGTYIAGGPQTWTASTLDLVNSMAIHYTNPFNASITPEVLAVNLAPDAAPANTTFIGLYTMGATNMTINGLSIRYDDVAASGENPTLYELDGSTWNPLSTTDSGDIATYAGGGTLSETGDYALGIVTAAPEPTTYALLLGGMLALGICVRRRRV